MTDQKQQRRLDILANPTETPRIECKSWLDLTDNHHKAVIAKAAIALANSGGGVIVFGVGEDNTQGGKLICKPKPSYIQRYTTDAVSSAINKYADPNIDFELKFANHPDTNDEHAFVEILGGMRQPVFAKKTYDTVIKKYACYVRKPGPKSEEPASAQEWRDLLNRCVLANRDSMLDSIRVIMDGRPVDATPPESNRQQLLDFMASSKSRWQARLDDVAEDDVARLRHGYWAFAFSIVGDTPWRTLKDLRDTLDEARPAGYRNTLFTDLTGLGRSSYPTSDSIEAWMGHPDRSRYRTPYSCSYWRANLGGQFYHLIGFLEDSQTNRVDPGARLYVDISLQLHAVMLRLAAKIAQLGEEDAEMVICSELTGLKGRYATGSQAFWDPVIYERCSQIDSVALPPQRLTPQMINDNLVEILYDYLYPLYEKFNYYELQKGWVEAAVETVKGQGW